MKKIALIFILLVAASVICSKALAQNLDDLTREISDTTMSPYCPGMTISACPSPRARDLRVQIKKWFEQGYTKKAVKNQLKIAYGKDIYGMPELKGFGLFAWAFPILFILVGLFLIYRVYNNTKKKAVIHRGKEND